MAELVLRVGKPQILDLTGAPALVSLKGAERLPSLTSIVAIDCPVLASAEGVSGLPELTQLHFTDSVGLSDTTAIQRLPNLKSLDLSGCVALEETGLKELPSLENLYLSRCRSLKSLDVSAFPGLRQLYVDGCAGLTAITGLERLTSLTDLDVSNATGLAGLPGVGGFPNSSSSISGIWISRISRGSPRCRNFESCAWAGRMRSKHWNRSLPWRPSANFTSRPARTSNRCAGFLRGLAVCGFYLLSEARFTRRGRVGGGARASRCDGCENLVDVSAAAKLTGLVQVSFVKCRGVTAVPFVETLPKLRIVMLGGSGVVPAVVEGLKAANEEIIFDFAVAE